MTLLVGHLELDQGGWARVWGLGESGWRRSSFYEDPACPPGKEPRPAKGKQRAVPPTYYFVPIFTTEYRVHKLS